jgi:hypothetical protein
MMIKVVACFPYVSFQERAAGALANLAADDKCSTEVAVAGGVHALVMLARNCKFEGVQEQVVKLSIVWIWHPECAY